MMMMMMRIPSFLVVSLKSHLQNPSYPSSVVENAYNCFVGVSGFDAGAQRLHKRGILRKKGAETFGEETRTFDRNLYRSLDPKLKDGGGGCGGGVSEIANVFSDPNAELIRDWILKILNAAAFVIDATVAKKKNLKP
jgi:hypothetical protein